MTLLLAVMTTEVVDAAGGCTCDGGVVSVVIVGVHPVLEPASAVGFSYGLGVAFQGHCPMWRDTSRRATLDAPS